MDEPRIIEFPKVADFRGNLSFAQNGDGRLPFDVRRVFWIYDIPADVLRGGHAHHSEMQVLISVAGSLNVNLFDGEVWCRYSLNRPFQGLFIPPGYWRTMDGFSSGTAVVVLSSMLYDGNDYIRDFDEFLKLKSIR